MFCSASVKKQTCGKAVWKKGKTKRESVPCSCQTRQNTVCLVSYHRLNITGNLLVVFELRMNPAACGARKELMQNK